MHFFERFFSEQTEFLNQVLENLPDLSNAEKIKWTKEYVLHANSELIELLDEVKWKTWLATGTVEPPDLDSLGEEVIDVWKFLLNICIVWGIDPEKFVELWERKSEVNRQRFLQHRELKQLLFFNAKGIRKAKIAAVDLDGVLAQYPEHWLEYLNKSTSIDVALKDFSLVYGTTSISRSLYSSLKDRYRRSGQELRVTPMPGAKEFLETLRNRGYTIVILSARPTSRYKRLYGDSIYWLRMHALAYNHIVWDQMKEERIIKELPIVEFVVEDDPQNAERLAAAEIKVFLLSRPYNESWQVCRNVTRVASLAEILERLVLV